MHAVDVKTSAMTCGWVHVQMPADDASALIRHLHRVTELRQYLLKEVMQTLEGSSRCKDSPSIDQRMQGSFERAS